MGLDACVYKSLTTMEAEFGDGLFRIIDETGECEPLSETADDLPWRDTVAEHHRIGNISMVQYLRHEVASILGSEDSCLQRLVLYSGTHCGDFITHDRFPDLLRELEQVKQSLEADVRQFAEDMESLVRTAYRENNPVVF